MKKNPIITFIILCIIYQGNAKADTLMDLYKASIKKYPSVKSYTLKNKSLQYNIKDLEKTRLSKIEANVTPSVASQIKDISSGLSLEVIDTIDISNHTDYDIYKLEIEIQKNNNSLKLEKKNIFLKISDDYFNLLKTIKLKEIHQKTLSWIEKNIFVVEQGIKGGIFPSNDISRWNIEKYTQLNLIENDNLQIKKSVTSLKILTGIENINTNNLDIKIKNINLDKIVTNSPELSNYQLSSQQSEIDIKKENSAWLPTVQVSNKYDSTQDSKTSTGIYTLSALLNFNIFEAGRADRIKGYKYDIEYNNNEFFKQKTDLINQYSQQLVEIDIQKKVLENSKHIVDISETNLDKLLIGYKRKFIDLNTLIISYKDYLSAQETYTNTLVDLDKNYQTLYHLSEGDIFNE